LRQIPPETGRFLALLAASAPKGAYIEVGTSAGYSTLWLALVVPIGKGELVCRKRGKPVDKLVVITGGYARRFPDGDEPFQMMTRLLEECGELA
jgi:hypothetical protein